MGARERFRRDTRRLKSKTLIAHLARPRSGYRPRICRGKIAAFEVEPIIMALVLVIDDEEDARRVVEVMLKNAGHDAVLAVDGNVSWSRKTGQGVKVYSTG